MKTLDMGMDMQRLQPGQRRIVVALKTADEGQLITKRKIAVVTRKFITRRKVKEVKKTVIKKLGMTKMKKMGKKKVLKVVDRELRKEAVTMLKDLGYQSACRGACGRRMKVITGKIKAIKKKTEVKMHKLEEFKTTVVKKQLKQYGIMVNTRISSTYYKEKQTFLNAKFAKGEITKAQYTQYTTMMKKWTTINRKTLKIKVKKLKEEKKTGQITVTDFKIKIKKLKKRVKPEVQISEEQKEGVVDVLKSKVKIGKISKTQYKIAINKVKSRTLITKAQFNAEVSGLKIKMNQGEITPIVYKKEVKQKMKQVKITRRSYIKKTVKLRTQVVKREITRKVYKTTVEKMKLRVAPITKISKTNFKVMKGKLEKMVVENKISRAKFQT